MNVDLDRRYPLEAGVEAAWTVLRDVRTTAACMPGAAITEQIDETRFNGTVRSKVGPATMTFGGQIEVLGIDPATRELRMAASGADKAGSSASMELTARIDPDAAGVGSVLVGHAVVSVNGKLAQFGGRLLVPVADMMLSQFAKQFGAVAAAVPAPALPEAAAAEVAEVAEAAEVADAPPVHAPLPLQPARELNALAFGWALVKGWFTGLFGRRA